MVSSSSSSSSSSIVIILRADTQGKKLQISLLFFAVCLSCQQHASVFWGRICSDDCTCCHAKIEVANQTCYNKKKKNNSNNNIIRIQRRNSLRREPFPTRTLKWPGRNRVPIMCNTPGAYHLQHVVLRATWYEGTAQLLSLTELKSHLF